MNPSDDTPTLSVVPDDAEAPAEEPKAFTFEDVLLDNGRMVRALIDTHGLEDQAAVSLFTTTLQGHLQTQQLRQMREEL